jgi:hypothetical protein
MLLSPETQRRLHVDVMANFQLGFSLQDQSRGPPHLFLVEAGNDWNRRADLENFITKIIL